MPIESNYLIIETDGSFEGWGAVLKSRPHKYSSKKEEKIRSVVKEDYFQEQRLRERDEQ